MNLIENAISRVRRAFRTQPPVLADAEPRPALPAPSSQAAGDERPSTSQLFAPEVEAGDAVAEGDLHGDFTDLLTGLGAEPTEPAEVSALEAKDREIAELQRNLEMLRPIGDELARVEQLRLAERAEFEARLAELEATSAAGPRREAGRETRPELRQVSRLLDALDTELAQARAGGPRRASAKRARVDLEARLTRTLTKLENVRTRSAEWKDKAGKYRAEGQALRARIKELQRESSVLRAERKRLYAPVRELARRAGKRPRAVARLVELLGLETAD